LEPPDTTSGAYTIKGTFTPMKPSGHTNYYGLVFGGSGLDGSDQSYLYFVVAQDGPWLIKSRNGAASLGVFWDTAGVAEERSLGEDRRHLRHPH
jgi:hypothetical protein